jgi:catechol 1,2-dioxygenase
VTRALVGDIAKHSDPHPEHPEVATPWYSLTKEFVMRPGHAELPRPPIA